MIKLRLHGMMSVATLKGTKSSLFGGKVQMESPICVGPLPALSDVKLALNGDSVKPGAAIKAVCDKLGYLCAVPIEQVREVVRATPTKNPFLLYVVPD